MKYSKSYKPFVMALVGMILEKQKFKSVEKNKNLLNPLSFFKLPIDNKKFPNKKQWHFL